MWNDDVTPEVFLLDSHLIACEFRSSCVRVFLVLLRSELRNSRRNARKLLSSITSLSIIKLNIFHSRYLVEFLLSCFGSLCSTLWHTFVERVEKIAFWSV